VKSFFQYFALSLLLGLVFTGDALAAEGLDESRRSLETILQRIEKTSKDLEAKKGAERSLASDLKTVEREMGRIKDRLSSLARRLSSLEREIADKEKESAENRKARRETEIKVKKRLSSLYKSGEMGVLRALFATESPAEMTREFVYMGRVVRRDRELLQAYRRHVGELETSLRQLENLRQEQQTSLAAVRGEQETLHRAVEIKRELLAKIREDSAALSGVLEEMRQRAARLTALIKKLETERPPEYTQKIELFALQKGRLLWPASGSVKISFGTGRHPDLGTLYDSQGYEIATPQSAPISAVWSGRVVFADRFQGYGNLLIVDHGESYYTLYAQASRLLKSVGEKVTKGENIALAGFEGTEGFYFEIRHRGTPLDPAAWLSPR
jgi:septal ring factor EnvC (AmiA/AmiB activator)